MERVMFPAAELFGQNARFSRTEPCRSPTPTSPAPAWFAMPPSSRPTAARSTPPSSRCDALSVHHSTNGVGTLFTTAPPPAAEPGSGSCAGSEPPLRRCSRRPAAGRTRLAAGSPVWVANSIVVLCEHDVTGGDLGQSFRADGRKLTKERRCAPTSVHVRRIPRSRSPDLAFNFTGMRSPHDDLRVPSSSATRKRSRGRSSCSS